MSENDPAFERLLEFLGDGRGFDYTSYRRPSLIRRFEKRMQAVGASTYEEYQRYLEENPDEYAELFNTILINVTGFFRDREAWDVVASDVIPRLLEQRDGDAPIRVWSAGCASGEEPYSAAILLAEALGEDAFRERVKIYATDIDHQALAQGREASFSTKQLAEVPEELRERYFTNIDGRFVFRTDIRRSVIFGRNDLLQDPPISRVDLLVSRNTLMYFSPPAQERILSNFYFALNPGGFMMVGKAEALQSRAHHFEPYDLKRRIFVKNAGGGVAFRMPHEDPPPAEPLLGETAFEHAPSAQIVIDPDGKVAALNHAARTMFGLKAKDVGRPLQDLEVSYRPIELRSLIDEVRTHRRPLSTKDVSWRPASGEQRSLDVQVMPLYGSGGDPIGISVSFADVTAHRTLQSELEQARRELETAYEELQSTVEELETTNEELQSTNEELETTNEELQSTNEELETMNEELQSTNEELETMNDEMRDRADDALRANSFLNSILAGINQSVVVLDRDLRVIAWSRAATDLWGLRDDEVEGDHFLNLDIGLPVGELRDPIRATLAGDQVPPIELQGHNRRGQPINCTLSFAELRTAVGAPEGVIVVATASRAGD